MAKIYFLNVKINVVHSRETMKVLFNTALPVNSHLGICVHKNDLKKSYACYDAPQTEGTPPVCNLPHITFKAKPDSVMLLSQADKLYCAYSRSKMLSPYTFRAICSKLSKKPNAQSAINFLKEYREYMPKVETEIFDMLEEYGVSGKKTLQDILTEKRPESLARLREKQKCILTNADGKIMQLDKDIAEEVLGIRDAALISIDDGSFSRHKLLDRLKMIEAQDTKTKTQLHNIYKRWYTLPRSYMDYDAFVVKYSKFSHEEIAQRFLSMAVATVEHIKPYAKGGQDNLLNYVLVCKLYNNDKSDMNLAEYDELNPDIEISTNLIRYINDIKNEIKHGNRYFEANYLYPKHLGENIALETGWASFLNVAPENLKNFRKTSQISGSQKGSNRYRTNHK